MGYPKTAEDINEKIDNNQSNIPNAYREPEPEVVPVPVRVCTCLYCNESFSSNDELFEHMRKEHNSLSTAVLLNERIIEPGSHIETGISALRVFPRKNITTIKLNGKTIETDIHGGLIDLTHQLKGEFTKIILEVDGSKWEIHKSITHKLNPKVHEIVCCLDDLAVHCKRPDLTEVRRQICENKLDFSDENYIMGFYEYCLASFVNTDDKDRLYFSAYNRLLPYVRTEPRARQVLKIICLRFLWVDNLNELCRISIPNEFSLVCDFLQSKTVGSKPVSENNSDEIFSVFVDNDEYDNTQAIVNFMTGNYNAVRHYLGKTLHVAENERINENLRDRIFLLQARLSEHEGNMVNSKYYNDRIVCMAIVNARRKSADAPKKRKET